MQSIGKEHSVELKASGPPAMPYVRVADDPSFRKQQALCSIAVQNGLYLHPHHNWFLSAAHTASVIDESLERFRETMSRFATELSN